jgi:hypothetical protein
MLVRLVDYDYEHDDEAVFSVTHDTPAGSVAGFSGQDVT